MLFSLPEYTQKLRLDLRYQRVYNETLKRIHLDQKKKIEQLEKEVLDWKEKYQEKEKGNERLKQKIEQITKTQNRYKIALFDHGNFKNPNGEEKKTKGGQIGHADTNPDAQRDYSSYQKQRIFSNVCGKCGRKLLQVTGIKNKTLIDIQVNTELLKVIISSERQWCGNCKKEVNAAHPSSLPFTEYGINTFMVVMYLRFKGKQSLRTIATTLAHLFGLPLSKAGVGTILTQAKEYLRENYEELKQAIRSGDIMYNDETSWSVRGKSAWMWIMANEEKTIYVPAESRGKGIMEQLYGNSTAHSMHDGYAGYTNTVPKDRQLYCWAHFLRFIHEETILATKGSMEQKIKEDLVKLYQTIRAHPEYSSEQKECILSENITKLLEIPQENPAVSNILYRLRTQKAGLIQALLITTDGTNNLAERELRPLTISRNISYGSDTYQGMETTAILASIVQTVSRDKTKAFLPTLETYVKEGIQKKHPQYKHPPSFAT